MWVRGHENVRKRVLIQAAGCNLGLLLRRLTGVGTPRSLQGRALSAICGLIGRLSALLGASDGLLGLPMDAGGAGRLNRSSPSCLNRPAQRTAFFHGLVGGHHQIAAMRTRIPSGPVFDTAAWRGRVRACGSRRGERRVGGHGSRAAGAARESTTTPATGSPGSLDRRRKPQIDGEILKVRGPAVGRRRRDDPRLRPSAAERSRSISNASASTCVCAPSTPPENSWRGSSKTKRYGSIARARCWRGRGAGFATNTFSRRSDSVLRRAVEAARHKARALLTQTHGGASVGADARPLRCAGPRRRRRILTRLCTRIKTGSSNLSVGGMKRLLASLELIEVTRVLEIDVGWVAACRSRRRPARRGGWRVGRGCAKGNNESAGSGRHPPGAAPEPVPA